MGVTPAALARAVRRNRTLAQQSGRDRGQGGSSGGVVPPGSPAKRKRGADSHGGEDDASDSEGDLDDEDISDDGNALGDEDEDEREEDEANRVADEAQKKQRAERRQKHEEAKLEHERSVGAMQEVVTKLQGDKSKLFQLLKQ
jgi:hypothetical protein